MKKILLVSVFLVGFLLMVGCEKNSYNLVSSEQKKLDTGLVYSLDEFILEDQSSSGELYDGFFYQFKDSGRMKVKFYGETNWDVADFKVTVNDNGVPYFEYIKEGEKVNGEHGFTVDYVNLSIVDFTLHLQSFARVYKYIKLFDVKIYKIG